MRVKKMFYMILGCIGVGLGTVGTVVPVLPTFPFLLLAVYSFARSSEKLHTWFIRTKLYKKNLESYVQGRGMTRETKVRVMITLTVLMAFGFFMMIQKALYVPCVILACVWVFHILYFIFGVKNRREEDCEIDAVGQ